MLIQTAVVVAAFLCTWALVDFVLVFVTSLLPKHVEIDCAKQYAPQRIAIVGPPKGDVHTFYGGSRPPGRTESTRTVDCTLPREVLCAVQCILKLNPV